MNGETPSTYRFVLTFEVEPGHEAYADPEWAADAAWGAITNLYGLRSIYSGIEELDPSEGLFVTQRR